MVADTSKSLLDKLRQSTSVADWNVFVQLYRPWIERLVCARKVPEKDRDDLIQEIFTNVLNGFLGFRHNGRAGAFRTWLGKIVAHEIWHYFRGVHRASETTFTPELFDGVAWSPSEIEQEWALEHDKYLVSRLLEIIRPDFSETTWKAFVRIVIQGQPAETVAGELGVTRNTVMIAKSRVMRRLRTFSRDMLDDL